MIQLQHDGAQKAKERTSALRREVYLGAVEELTKANVHLASLPQADLLKTNAAEGLQGFFSAAAKLQLIAEPKTALLVNHLAAAYGELMLRLMSHLMPIQKVKIDISISDGLYNKYQTEVDRILGEMAKFNEAAKVDGLVFGALQRAFESYQSQAKKHGDDRSAAQKQFSHLNIEFSRQVLTELRAIGELHIPVMIEIRRDLGFESDIKAFHAQMEAQWIRMSSQLDKMLNSLKDV